jgi:hypothetical protein
MWLPWLSHGQSLHSKEEVRNLFPKNTKNLWINYLSGGLDGGHTMDMIIGTDGETCRGLYTMRNSKTTFYFDGQNNNNELQLVESDVDGKTTGFLIGHYDGANFDGTWYNRSKKLELKFSLGFVNSFYDYQPRECREDQWEIHCVGLLDNKNVSLYLKKNEGLVTCNLTEDGLSKKDIMPMSSMVRINNLYPSLPGTTLDKKTIVIDTLDYSKVTVSALDDNQYEQSQNLELRRRVQYRCYEYADFSSRLTMERPVIGHKKFDPWILSKCTEWIEKSLTELGSKNSSQDRWSDRWSQIAFGWVELDLFDDDMISGTLHFQKSWVKGIEKVPFIYSLKMGKEINIKQIFKPKYNYKPVFDEAIERYTSSARLASNRKLWFENHSFKHCTLTKEGISLRTDFSIIHGEEQVIIPYAEFMDNIRYKSIKKEFSQAIP